METWVRNKNYYLFLALVLGVSSVTFLYAQKIRAETDSRNIFGEESALVLYSEKLQEGSGFSIVSLDFNLFKNRGVIQRNNDSTDQMLFLSPNRKYLAVTNQGTGDVSVTTKIIDLNGKLLTQDLPGSFVSWSPDSQRVLVFRSSDTTGKARQIYSLSIDGKYVNVGLPDGVISADISPVDSSIVYSITENGSDRSVLHVKSDDGGDLTIKAPDERIIAWMRWSPDGKNIAFLESDLGGSGGKQTVHMINSDGTDERTISQVLWNYPPVWSPDGLRIAFASDGNIWEYSLEKGVLEKTTNLQGSSAKQPVYSNDGSTILFSDGEEIWSVREGVVKKVTDTSSIKSYPNIL